ncbi:MAG: Asp-tRNA(Asn)/Glu-tRNA(Gln) amidotransferase subunit GatB [bacterium]|nr:Asp-tRNA(Asn)/Glu-tRNA(Gln) amidotransferase subunit GatB [bacterium]
MKYEPVIGLEIHAELATKSKMFCTCRNDPEETKANVNVCPICLGHPGTLPVPNKAAINEVIKVGLALGCQIALRSKFDRKNYFYPDLPKGYQISQYDLPLCEAGKLTVDGRDIRVTRVHLEEDTARLQHDSKGSLVDFNRAGVPLLELVTEPDITSAAQAKRFAEELQLILRYVGASSADMEKGLMRIEANVSVREEGAKKLGTKVEVKNLNSFKTVERASEYEVRRQSEALAHGGKIAQETRGWDEAGQKTVSQRSKEEAQEYRYFPEPDIPILIFESQDIENLKAQLPELPQDRRARLRREYELGGEAADLLVRDKALGEYFEHAVSELGEDLSPEALNLRIQLTSNYLTSDLLGLIQSSSFSIEDVKITPENFAELISMIAEKKISTPAAKTVLKEMFGTGADPSHIVEERGLAQMSDEQGIRVILQQVIRDNEKAVSEVRAGKEKAVKFLVGQAMAQSKGALDPERAEELLRQLLS